MAERGHRDVSHATGEVLDGSRSPGRSRPWVRRVRREVCSDFFPWIRMFYLYFSSVVALCLIHGICTALITFFFLDDNFFEWPGSYSFTMLINFVDRYRLTAYGLTVGSPKADPETRGSEMEGKSQKRELQEAGHSSVQSGSCWGPRRGRARTSELPPSQEHPALFGEGLPWGMTSDIPAPRPQAQLQRTPSVGAVQIGEPGCRRGAHSHLLPTASTELEAGGPWGPNTHAAALQVPQTSAGEALTVTTPSWVLPQDKAGPMNQVSGCRWADGWTDGIWVSVLPFLSKRLSPGKQESCTGKNWNAGRSHDSHTQSPGPSLPSLLPHGQGGRLPGCSMSRFLEAYSEGICADTRLKGPVQASPRVTNI